MYKYNTILHKVYTRESFPHRCGKITNFRYGVNESNQHNPKLNYGIQNYDILYSY